MSHRLIDLDTVAGASAPVVKALSAPSEGIHCGAQVPLVVQFNEPVRVDGISLEVDGQTIVPLEPAGTIADAVSFLYQVGADALGSGSISVSVENITARHPPARVPPARRWPSR